MVQVRPGTRVKLLFGSTNDAGCVPGELKPSDGPVYLEGRLVLSLSFQGDEAVDLGCLADKKAALARYRLWDDLSEGWYDGGLTVLRFEGIDVVMKCGRCPVPVWTGALDMRKRVVLVPDLDDAGYEKSQAFDLCWKETSA